ncbi:uncharacterized protein LOC141788681 [Halichoeres trimaculatus]|uniref:uncharacterized protein LOC141788681 n=1 Tax=Halichoeres trimaculatus TaxID=147232 RepID=UPI003D9E06AE
MSTMDQENSMDFKALRAKFQEEELLLKQPKIKPALPEKPKVVPPPTSPTHYLPAGARPSLLTSINQTLEGKSQVAPRVVFKNDKKESKKPLIQNQSKEGKLKKGKDKSSKGSKEKLDEDPSDQKPKKESKEKKVSSLFAPKDTTADLVPASPPPKNTIPKKKGFLGFKKSTKRDSVEVISDPILDSPSPDVAGLVPLTPAPLSPAPLIPVPSDFGDAPEPELSPLKALLPNIPPLPESSAAVEVTSPPIMQETPDFTQPPSPSPEAPQNETCLQGETLALNLPRPASQSDFSPPSAVPTPPPSQAGPASASTPSPAPPEPLAAVEPDIEAMIRAAVEKPPDQVKGPPSKTPSPKVERPITALSALERAEELSPGKRTPPCDQRIFNALEKARRKTPSSLSTPSTSVTPPPEEYPSPQSPTPSFPELPPIDYEAGRPALLNGLDHGESGITEEGSDPIPELLVVPPPPPRKILPDPESLGLAPEKPDRPASVDLSRFIPPPPVEDVPAPVEFSETDTTDVPEFDDVTSDAHSPELQVSEWGNEDHTGPDFPDGQNPLELYSTRIPSPGAEVHAAPTYGDNPLPVTTIPVPQESPPPAGVPLLIGNGIYESTENVYEDIGTSATKKKGKTDGKKRKGPPKNPYAEAAQEGSEEKNQTGKFSKNDKKAPAEGLDVKELKKKEKQRQEKERKEQKEKQEREKKEQKEREKKENELKKKFKITGQEDAMYEATVTVTTKGRKNDLPVNDGDVISIIRTTNCPKGKWLAKDCSNNYGYIAVDHVRLDIQEMLNMGKKAAISRKTNNNNNNEVVETEMTRTGSRSSNHYPLSAESFTDDSEEWTGDDDEPLTPPPNPTNPQAIPAHTRTLSMPDMGIKELNVNHQHSHSDINPDGTYDQARHEALQKLATFFHAPKPVEPAASSTEPETGPALLREEAAALPDAGVKQDMDYDQSDLFILPPPDLYADLTVE